MLNRIARRAYRYFVPDELPHVDALTLELNNAEELKKAFGWTADPDLIDPIIHEFDYLEDLNERRVRDAEALGLVARNAGASTLLEIGTAEGHSTALMAMNAPRATVYTVNIPPGEVLSGAGGVLTTIAIELEKIGSYYRGRSLTNVKQIYANTATWTPEIGLIDVAFIDGCHDADFVYNDTVKALGSMKEGGFVVWHDFNPALRRKFNWIQEVCTGVERLIIDGHVRGRILHLRDSWMGIYRV